MKWLRRTSTEAQPQSARPMAMSTRMCTNEDGRMSPPNEQFSTRDDGRDGCGGPRGVAVAGLQVHAQETLHVLQLFAEAEEAHGLGAHREVRLREPVTRGVGEVL